ncbi:MAG: ABC transporter ATP-binding protein [Opitutae bacterium]|nr:ABC transporter ATP-binding protein [Opitutae bacterium]
MNPAVQFERVTLRRHGGRPALDAVSLTLPAGSLAAVLGPNGAGKSTLLRAANGELRPASGTVRVLGEDAQALDWRAAARWRRRIGVMPQFADHAPAVPLTVREVVEIGRVAHGRRGASLSADDRAICTRWLERFGLSALAERSFAALSGGEQRKAHLARIFAQEPELILLDEPAGHLDLPAQDALTRLIAEVWRETRATVLIVTHELRHLPPDTTHVILLADGKIVAEGAPRTTLTSATLSRLFGEPLEVFERGGRYAAVATGEGGGDGHA